MNIRKLINLVAMLCFITFCSLMVNVRAQPGCNRQFDGSVTCRLSTSLVRKIAPGSYAIYYQLQGGRRFLSAGLDPNCLGDKIKDSPNGSMENVSFVGHEFLLPGPNAPTDSQRFFVTVPNESISSRITVIVKYHDANNNPFYRYADIAFQPSTSTNGMPFTVPSLDLAFQPVGCPIYAGPIPSGG